jgi:hypothetical protein
MHGGEGGVLRRERCRSVWLKTVVVPRSPMQPQQFRLRRPRFSTLLSSIPHPCFPSPLVLVASTWNAPPGCLCHACFSVPIQRPNAR